MTSRSIVIAASQRSGSTLLGRALELTGAVGTPREWFQNSDREERMRAYRLRPDTPHIDLLKRIVRNETTPEGIFPLKIMWDTMEPLLLRLRDNTLGAAEGDGRDFERFSALLPQPRFVLVTRRDKLKQAVSFVKSVQSGVWEYRGKEVKIDPELLAFDYLAIRGALAKFEHEEAAWKAFFAANEIPHLHIVYEDFVKEYEGTLREVFAFLGMPAPERLEREAMDLRVMSDGVNKAWIDRFREYSSALRPVGDANTPEARIALELLDAPDRVEAGKRFRVRARATNAGKTTVYATGGEDGRHWTYLRAQWIRVDGGTEYTDGGRGYLNGDLAPGTAGTVSPVLTAPAEAGDYTLRYVMTHRTGDDDTTAISRELEHTLAVEWSEAEAEIRRFFPDAVAMIGGWKWIPWFGYFYTPVFPWMCHEELGWLLFDTEGSADGGFWFHENSLGWFRTAPGEFPEILRKETEERLVYEGPIGKTCRFRRISDDGLIDVTPKFR